MDTVENVNRKKIEERETYHRTSLATFIEVEKTKKNSSFISREDLAICKRYLLNQTEKIGEPLKKRIQRNKFTLKDFASEVNVVCSRTRKDNVEIIKMGSNRYNKRWETGRPWPCLEHYKFST